MSTIIKCKRAPRTSSSIITWLLYLQLIAILFEFESNGFCKQGQAPDTEVGRVYVYDLDDWDLPDKKFYWDTKEHPNFSLHQDTGMLTMRHGTRDGKYHLRFRVYDRKHTQVDVPANVTITVREITHEAVTSSGSIRMAGISDEDFIRIWDYRVCHGS